MEIASVCEVLFIKKLLKKVPLLLYEIHNLSLDMDGPLYYALASSSTYKHCPAPKFIPNFVHSDALQDAGTACLNAFTREERDWTFCNAQARDSYFPLIFLNEREMIFALSTSPA